MKNFNKNILIFTILNFGSIECNAKIKAELVVSSCHTDSDWIKSSGASEVLRSWIRSITVPARNVNNLKLLRTNWIKGIYQGDKDEPGLQSMRSPNVVWMRNWPYIVDLMEGWHYVK